MRDKGTAQSRIPGANEETVPGRLARRLTTVDAVMIGMGAMIGAGIFAVVAPTAAIAGNGLLAALLVAASVAYCNATSSAQLAARYPESGGAYVYGRKELGHYWGFLAGWGFVAGKMASCAAMALTFANYAFPEFIRPAAVAAVLCVTAINYVGVQKTALFTRLIVAVVLGALAITIVAVLAGGDVAVERLAPRGWSAYAILQAAGLWFFAFAGYARIATLGEEVVDPRRTIPGAVPIALGITLLLYLIVAISAVLAVDIETLAEAPAPLAAAVESGDYAHLSPVVKVGAGIACLGVLLSLSAGVGRTTFAMASANDLPKFLAAVHPRYRIPHRAELSVGILVALLIAISDLRSAIGFSSFTVLTYYAIANAAALRLNRNERQSRKWLPLGGLLGCGLLAFSLPLMSVAAGTLVLLTGTVVYRVAHLGQGSS